METTDNESAIIMTLERNNEKIKEAIYLLKDVAMKIETDKEKLQRLCERLL